MIANKMESSGLEGRILVSEATKDLIESTLKNTYNFNYNDMIETKVSNILSYWVEPKNE